jgi:hypothetical protein
MKKFLFIALIFNLTLACNHAPKLKLTSFVRYIAPENAIQADVSIFNEKNPTTAIKVDKLFFNGGAMEKKENKIQGIVYRSERDGKYPTDFSYVFNFEKKDYQATFKASAIKDLVVVDSLAHKKNGIKIRWNGEPLKKDETLTAIISDEEGTSAEAQIQGATQSNEVLIPGAMFSGLKTGKGSVFIVKRRTEFIDNQNLSIESAVEFYSKTVTVDLRE